MEGEIAGEFPFVLGVEVVLAEALALDPEGDGAGAGAVGLEGVVLEVAEEDLLDAGGYAEEVVYGVEEAAIVGEEMPARCGCEGGVEKPVGGRMVREREM